MTSLLGEFTYYPLCLGDEQDEEEGEHRPGHGVDGDHQAADPGAAGAAAAPLHRSAAHTQQEC